jgi:hypothetical protein
MPDETKIAAALKDLANQTTPNYQATAKKHKVSRATLTRRFLSQCRSAVDGHIEQQGNLSLLQEKELLDWIKELTNRKLPPTPAMVKSYVERLLGHEIGKNWVSRFFNRHRDSLNSKYLGGLDANRVYATASASCFETWFKNAWISYLFESNCAYEPQFKTICDSHRFKPDEIINLDEKGFMIGRQMKTKRYFTRDSKLSGVKQDGSREWITILAAITAAGRALSPGIIYQSATRLVREDWIRDWDLTNGFRALVTSTESGWINAELALQWLTEVIDKETKCPGGRRRLLLLDGHSTHLTMPFLAACDSANIIPALIPAHSTHLMQPLDVGMFGPLSRAYSEALETKQSSLPLAAAISKGDFWRLFEQAYKAAFTSANIRSAFAASGIYPRQPLKVLARIPKRKADDEAEPTLTNKLREIRRKRQRQSIYRKPEVQELIGELERAAVKADCATFDITQLRATIDRQRKKTANSKQLQHPDLPELGKGLFFTPGKIVKAREWEEEKIRRTAEEAAARAANAAARELKKASDKAERERKKAERLEHQQQRAIAKAEAAKSKAEDKARRQAMAIANKQAAKELKLARQAQKKSYRRVNKAADAINLGSAIGQNVPKARVVEVIEIDEAAITTRTGRTIKKPARFKR